MVSLRTLNRRAGSVFAVAALVLSTALPGLASAATVTERSIALDNTTVNAAGVKYTVNFKTATAGTGAFLVDFCSDTPVIGESCATPTDFDTQGVTATGGTATRVDANTIKVVLTAPAANAGDEVEVELGNIHNPSVRGTMYARIVTYANDTQMNGYTDAGSVGTHLDDGGVAISIHDTIAVSAAVLESLQFCVSAGVIDDNCTFTTEAYKAPTLKLGDPVPGSTDAFAIDSSKVHEGAINTQLSTNAASGATVNIKSHATCAGLHRAGAASNLCDIAAAGTTGTFAGGTAKFGISTGAATPGGEVAASGVLQPAGVYAASQYRFDPSSSVGVMSPYGSLILDTDSKPANNRNMPLTFGASAANNTPAGNYSAALSLIATGKF